MTASLAAICSAAAASDPNTHVGNTISVEHVLECDGRTHVVRTRTLDGRQILLSFELGGRRLEPNDFSRVERAVADLRILLAVEVMCSGSGATFDFYGHRNADISSPIESRTVRFANGRLVDTRAGALTQGR